MAFQFSSAKREKLNLRVGIFGLSGSGKTRGALLMAYGLCHDWSKVFLIDADNRSSLGYVNDSTSGIGEFMFGALDAPYTAQRYQEAITAAAKAGAAVVIVDTMSQEWAGEGGIMEQHDNMGGNSYTNWGKVNPSHYGLINYITHKAPCHVIVNFRAKMKYALQEAHDGQKATVARLGEGPIMRPGTEYEFHLTLETNRDTFRADVITKRGSMLPDMRPIELNVALGEQLATWAESGIASPEAGKTLLVSQLKELYPGGGKEVAAMLKQLGLAYTVELHDEILVKLTGAKQPKPESHEEAVPDGQKA